MGSKSEASEANVLRPTLTDLLHDNFERFIHRHEERGYRLGFLRLQPPPEYWKAVQLPDNIINRKIDSTNSQQLIPLSKKIKVKEKRRQTNFPYYLQSRVPRHKSSVTEFKSAAAKNEPSTSFSSKRPKHKRHRCGPGGRGQGNSFWSEAPKSEPIDADEVEGSRCSLDTIYWSLPTLKTLLQRVCTYLGIILIGVTTPFLYYGQWLTKSCWHVEDLMLFNITYLHEGADKTWYVIPPAYRKEFADFANLLCGKEFGMHKKKRCDNFLHHKTFLMNPVELKKVGIPYTEVVQKEKEIIITFPGAYHCGYNHGYNCAESLNFAMPSWLPYGTEAKICKHDRRAVQFTSEMKIVADFMKDLIRKRMARARTRARHTHSEDSCSESEILAPHPRHPPPPTPPPRPPPPRQRTQWTRHDNSGDSCSEYENVPAVPQRRFPPPPFTTPTPPPLIQPAGPLLAPSSFLWARNDTSGQSGSENESGSLATSSWFPPSPFSQPSPPQFGALPAQFTMSQPRFSKLSLQFASSLSSQFAMPAPKFPTPPQQFATLPAQFTSKVPYQVAAPPPKSTAAAAAPSYCPDVDNTEDSDDELVIDLSSDDESDQNESVDESDVGGSSAHGGGAGGSDYIVAEAPHQNIQLRDLKVRIKRIKLLRKDDSHYVIDDDSDAGYSPSLFGSGEKGFASTIPISAEEEQFFGSLPDPGVSPASNYGTESEGLATTDTLNWDQLILNMHVQSKLSASGAPTDASKRGRFQCLRCLRVYSWKKNCMEHIRRVHQKTMTKTVKLTVVCPQCSKIFSNRSSLNRHFGKVHKTKESDAAPTTTAASAEATSAGPTWS